MGLLSGTLRASQDSAAAVTGAAGAVTGAVTGAAIGGLSGIIRGGTQGLGIGARSTPAAVLALTAVGAAGLVDWPILVAVGGAAIIMRQVRTNSPASSNDRPAANRSATPRVTPAKKVTSASARTPRTATPGKTNTRAAD